MSVIFLTIFFWQPFRFAFEPEAVRLAFEFSGGQPYLVNALARWCVEEIHGERFGETVTAADMREAKEKIIRERPGYLNSIWKRAHLPCVDRLVEAIASEKIEMIPIEALRSAEGFGVVRKERGGSSSSTRSSVTGTRSSVTRTSCAKGRRCMCSSADVHLPHVRRVTMEAGPLSTGLASALSRA